jgi:hypothetical protein
MATYKNSAYSNNSKLTSGQNPAGHHYHQQQNKIQNQLIKQWLKSTGNAIHKQSQG